MGHRPVLDTSGESIGSCAPDGAKSSGVKEGLGWGFRGTESPERVEFLICPDCLLLEGNQSVVRVSGLSFDFGEAEKETRVLGASTLRDFPCQEVVMLVCLVKFFFKHHYFPLSFCRFSLDTYDSLFELHNPPSGHHAFILNALNCPNSIPHGLKLPGHLVNSSLQS